MSDIIEVTHFHRNDQSYEYPTAVRNPDRNRIGIDQHWTMHHHEHIKMERKNQYERQR